LLIQPIEVRMNIKDFDLRAKLRPIYRFATRLPRGVRTLAGLVLIVAGVFGIVIPILGFWMAPLGLLFIAADVPPLKRRAERWLEGGNEREVDAEREAEGSAGPRTRGSRAAP
jgi:hypothetical protein